MIKNLFTKYKYRTIFLLIIISFANYRVYAQVINAEQQNKLQRFNPLTNNVEDVLPPLSVLLDSAAVHAAQVNYETLHATRNRYEIIRARLEWTQYFGVNLDGSWGNWIDHDFYLGGYNPNLGQTILTPPYVSSNRWDYAISFWVRFPLSSILKRKNEIMIGKKEVEMSLALRDQLVNEARLLAIQYYNLMIQGQNKMKISNEYQEYTRIQMQMADLQFENKEIEVAEYARLKEIQTRGAFDFEQYKSDFKMNYLLLEELTGIKFNLINELK